MIFPEQPQNPLLRGADACVPQASPNLAVAFSGKYWRIQKLANFCHQVLIAENPGTSLVRFPWMHRIIAPGVVVAINSPALLDTATIPNVNTGSSAGQVA